MVGLRSHIGEHVVVQARSSAYDGVLRSVRGKLLKLTEVRVLDNDARSPEWVKADGIVFIPTGVVEHVQVVV